MYLTTYFYTLKYYYYEIADTAHRKFLFKTGH